jgi:hypothetical protein
LLVTWNGQQLVSTLSAFGCLACDLKVDARGEIYVEMTVDDGTGYGSHFQLLAEFDPTGQSIDWGDGGISSTGDDFGYGIAIDGADTVYSVGKTNSTDFPARCLRPVASGSPWNRPSSTRSFPWRQRHGGLSGKQEERDRLLQV